MQRFLRFLLATSVLACIVFAVAGTWRDAWLWAYLGAWVLVGATAMFTMDDDLARERYRPPTRGADATALRMIRLVALAHLMVGVLDGSRMHWTTVAPWLRVVGLIGFALSFLLVVRAMEANRFFSAVVRVQDDRGHRVVDRGPYARVRHPGYAGMIAAGPFSGLALGSWWSVALGLLYSGFILRRVLFEDRFLHANLDGYEAYARRVRYRLVPALW